MIKLFGATDREFGSNGDIVINPIRAKVHKGDNLSFYLETELGLEYINEITSGRIIVCDTPQGQQPFRIGNIEKTNGRIKLTANHVLHDAKNYLISDSNVVNKSCNDALDHLNAATEPASPFTMLSDITSQNSYRCVRTTLYDALNEVLERWGGHLVADGFNISILSSITTDNGAIIRYGKNLKQITCDENWDDVVTKLMPVGKDGLKLPEEYLVSSVQYEIPYVKTVTFQQDIEEEAYPTEEEYRQALINDLRQQGANYLESHSLPKVNYSLSANLNKVTDVGDVIHVSDERYGVEFETSVISYEYDVVAKQYTNLEFGNFRKSLTNLRSEITANTQKVAEESAEKVRVTLGEELEHATDAIMSVMGNSYVIYDGNELMVVDSLPKTTAHNVLRINSAGIGFSQSGINGQFNSAWLIDGTLDMQQINVINLVADMIKGGTLKLGSATNQRGILELYDENNSLVGLMDNNGLKMYGVDGSYVLMNNEVGFAGYDRNGNKIYWVSGEEFHMKKSVVEEEITLCNKMRFIPITITENGVVVNDGIGLVSVLGGQ